MEAIANLFGQPGLLLSITSGKKLYEDIQYKINISPIGDLAGETNQRVYMDLGGISATTILRVQVFEDDDLVSTAVIGAVGGGTGVHKASWIAEKDRVVIFCSDSVFCLSLPALDLHWRTKADPVACFQVHAFQSDYIVHGEMEISRLDKHGSILWQRSGADIFTTLEGGMFELTENYIIVEDWQNRLYKFDYSGNDITN